MQLPPDHRHGPNCGVTAIALLSGQSFQTVWDLIAPRKAKQWQGSTYPEDWYHALRQLNVRYRTIPIKVRATVQGLAYSFPHDILLVCANEHVMILNDYYMYDGKGERPVDSCGYQKCVVSHAIRILK